MFVVVYILFFGIEFLSPFVNKDERVVKKSDKVRGMGKISMQFVKCKWNCHRKRSDVDEHIKSHWNGWFSHSSQQSVHPESPPSSEILADLFCLSYSVRALSFCVGERV